MKKRLSDLFRSSNNNEREPEVTSNLTSNNKEVDDDDAEDGVTENNGLMMLRFKRDIKDRKMSGGIAGLAKHGVMNAMREKIEQDQRVTKQIEADVAKDIKDQLFSSVNNDDVAELDKAVAKVNTLGVALHHKEFLKDDGKTALHDALEQRKMKVSGRLIEIADADFLAKGYVNIDRQIPPSSKTSLHILSEIGDTVLARKLLEKLKTLEMTSPQDEEKKNVSLFSHITSKMKKKEQSGIHDRVVLQIKGEPRRRVESVHLAAMNGHSDLIRILVSEYDFDVNSSDGEGQSPLAWACKNGHADVIKVLLELNADVNQGNGYECAPLHWAVERGHTEAVKALLKFAADRIDVNKDRVRSPRSPIEIAAFFNHPLIAKRLLKTGVVQKEKKLRALITSSEKGHGDVVKALLDNSPELLDEADEEGDTALLVAAEAGKLDVIQLLVELGADLTKKNYDRKTVFDLAMHHSDNAMIDFLMKVYRTAGNDYEDFQKETYYIHVAAAEGDASKIEFLHRSGIDYRMAFDKSGNSFVHAAVSNNRVNILEEFLLKCDDIINQQNSDGETPLHIAARKGYLASVEKLISLKARLHIADQEGRTALHSAVTALSPTSTRIVETIREAVLVSGSRILDEVDKSGFTALHLACKYKRADLIPELKLLNPECASKEGQTPLHVAARWATVDVMKVLLDVFSGPGRRINIDRRDDKGATALHIAALLGEEEKSELLVKRGADMALLDSEGASLLHRMIDVSMKTPTLADDMCRIYNIMVEAAPNWWARRRDIACPSEESRDFHLLRLEGVRYLTSQIFYQGMNVLQYASKAGALMLMKEILNTPNVYKIMRGSPLVSQNIAGDALGMLLKARGNNDGIVGDHTGLILSTMFLEKVILYDVTFLVPGNMPVKLQALERYHSNTSLESNKSSDSRKVIANSKSCDNPNSNQEGRNRLIEERTAEKCQTMSCLEFIVNQMDEQVAVDLLDSEPFKILVKNYWHLCRRGFEALMWLHVIYMACFTHFMIPTSAYMRDRFHINETNHLGTAKKYESSSAFHGLFLLWPIFILLYEVVSAVAILFRVHGIISAKELVKMNHLKLSEVTSGLMRIPMGTLIFAFNNLSHISSLAFSISIVTWYAFYINTTNAHTYLESLALAFVFGWLHTINYVKGFKDWNAFSNILKQIILKDLTRFIYIYIFVLVSFGYAIHVLMIADYMSQREDRETPTSTIYLTFYRMLSPGNVLDVSEDESYKYSGGSVPILRAVWAAYSCLSTVVLMNLLIAMMNSTYSEVQSMRSTAWRVESLRMALWVERHMPIIKHFKIVHFKTSYDRKQDRWYLKFKPEDYAELEEDDDDGTRPAHPIDDDDESSVHIDHTDAARIIKESDDVERSVQELKVEVTRLKNELESSREEERRSHRLLQELQQDMRRLAVAVKSTRTQSNA